MMNVSAPASNLAHLYKRVSSAQQLLGDGMRRQDDGTLLYIAQKKLEIVTTYSDRGVSAFRGKNRRVGELALILRHIQDGVIRPGEHLVIESIDRLSRQPPMEALDTLRAILASGVVVHSVFDNWQFTLADLNNDVGRLLALVVSMARANEESRLKSKRVADAHREGRATGKIVAGTIPRWLKLIRDPRTGEKKFDVDTDISPIVVSMFEKCADGLSSYRIGQELTADGVAPFGVPKKRIGSKATNSHHWNATSILNILRGKSVLGEFRSYSTSYDGDGKRIQTLESINPSYYPPIVAPELWQRANERLSTRRRHRIRGRTGETFANLLRGVCVCWHCGNSMHFKIQAEHRTKERYVRFRCAGRSENVCENNVMPRYAILETAILALVTEIEVEDRSSAEISALDHLIASDTVQIESLGSQIRTIIETFKGSESAATIVAEKEAAKNALQTILDAKLARRDSVASRQSPSDRRTALRSLRDRLNRATGPDLFTLRANLNLKIREVVDRVTFDAYGEIVVQLLETDDRYILRNIKRDGVEVFAIMGGNLEYVGSVRGQELLSKPYEIYDAREGRQAFQHLVTSGKLIARQSN